MPDPAQRGGLTRGELLRKSIHMAVGLGAFLVVFLGPLASALLAFALLLFNLFIWPRLGGRTVWRDRDIRRGTAVGIVCYPLVLLVLVLIFWRKLEVVAAAWAILAFGDGMATLVGGTLGHARLPWNTEKSWAGSLAFWVFGALGAGLALGWTLAHQEREIELTLLIVVAVTTALVATLIESWPSRLDDNLTVPLSSAAFLWGILELGWQG